MNLETIANCEDEILSFCGLDVTDVLAELADFEALKQAARETVQAGGDFSSFTRPELADDTKDDLKTIRECLTTIIPEDNVCSVSAAGLGGRGRFGKGRFGKKTEKIEACGGEIFDLCGIDVTPVLQQLAELEAAKQAARESGDFSALPVLAEDIKSDLMEIRRCFQDTIPEDSACLTESSEGADDNKR